MKLTDYAQIPNHTLTQHALLAQPTGNSIVPGPLKASDMATITMFTVICLPTLFLLSVMGLLGYQQRRSTVLKQRIQRLEKAWQIPCDRDVV